MKSYILLLITAILVFTIANSASATTWYTDSGSYRIYYPDGDLNGDPIKNVNIKYSYRCYQPYGDEFFYCSGYIEATINAMTSRLYARGNVYSNMVDFEEMTVTAKNQRSTYKAWGQPYDRSAIDTLTIDVDDGIFTTSGDAVAFVDLNSGMRPRFWW